MAFRNLWNALRSPKKRLVPSSSSASPVLQTIYQSLEDYRRIVNRLKRYEDITYSSVVRRFALLKQEMAAIFLLPPPLIVDRRVGDRRQADRPVAVDRRKRIDRRASR